MPEQKSIAEPQKSFDVIPSDSFHQVIIAATEMKQSVDPLVGQHLDGRYLIERNLFEGDGETSADRGGIGIVYLAQDLKNISRAVVIKAIKQEILQSDPDVLRKFQHEREALLRFDHPNIVGLLDSGKLPDGSPYLVMPFIQGYSLRRVLKKAAEMGERLSFNFCADVIEAVTDALAAAHHEQVLHRDIKPENVMLTQLANGKERVRLIDFGIARVIDSQVAPVTQVERAIGTVLYIAPEQLRGSLDQTPAVDVYSCAVTFYEMLTGVRPFAPKTILEMSDLQRAGVQNPPTVWRSEIPPVAEQILLQALNYEPQQRPQDIARFGQALAKSLRQTSEDETKRENNYLGKIPPAQQFSKVVAELSETSLAPTLPAHLDSQLLSLKSGNLPLLPPSPAKPKIRKIVPAVVAFLIMLLLGGGFVIWKFILTTPKDSLEANVSLSAPANSSPPAVVEPEKKSLSYFLEVQKMRSGMPFEEPFRATGREIFESGYKFKINLVSNTRGFLYLFNEGLDDQGGRSHHVLFPTPKRNGGRAEVEQNVWAETAYNTFDGGKGTEIVWVIWSREANDELEAARQNAFDNQGKVAETTVKQKLIDLLQKYSENQPETVVDKPNERTVIKSADNLIAYKIELDHK